MIPGDGFAGLVGGVGLVGDVGLVDLRTVRVTVDKIGETTGRYIPRRIATTGGRRHQIFFIAS